MYKRWAVFVFFLSVGIAWVTPIQAQCLSPIVRLGKIMYQDQDFSFNSTQSCMSCHHPRSGFADPDNTMDPYHSVVSDGADGISTGGRNAPTAAYAGYSPPLHWDDAMQSYVGGMFWDGRATGLILGDPLAEQAQGPPLNPVEMNMPDKEAVVQVVRDSSYSNLFIEVFGPNSLDDVDMAYDNIGRAIASYERSGKVQKFNSRFDSCILTYRERRGLQLFEANCFICHSSVSGTGPALFTNYAYENIGVPANPLLGDNPVDLGLGGFLESDYYSDTPLIGDADYAQQNGKFKVPTLRNVGLTPPYGHNGYFPTLREIVDFHNTRDSADWPAPEVPQNLNTANVGNMGMSDSDVDDIVAFLRTLSDVKKNRPRPHHKKRPLD